MRYGTSEVSYDHLSEGLCKILWSLRGQGQSLLYVDVFKSPLVAPCPLSLSSPYTMSFPSSTRVLVVGAGPAGMACALSLWYSGVKDVTLVEAVPQGNGNLSSRAMAIHAATLEVRSREHSRRSPC